MGGAGGRGVSATSASSSVVSISPSSGVGRTGAGSEGEGSDWGRFGRAGHAGSVAGWSPPQLAQWEGEAEQQSETGRRLPSLGQVGLGHRCSIFLWCSAQIGQTGWEYLQTGAV